MNLIEHHLKELSKLCESHHVKELYVFGSAVSKKFTEESDIDFLVEFQEIELTEYLDNYIDFKNSLEDLFRRNIDLVEKQTLTNPIFRKSIDNNKKRVYGKEDSEVTL